MYVLWLRIVVEFKVLSEVISTFNIHHRVCPTQYAEGSILFGLSVPTAYTWFIYCYSPELHNWRQGKATEVIRKGMGELSGAPFINMDWLKSMMK